MVSSQSLPNEQRVISSCSFGIKYVACICSVTNQSLYFKPGSGSSYSPTNRLTNFPSVNIALTQETVFPNCQPYTNLINSIMSTVLSWSTTCTSFMFYHFTKYNIIFHLIISVLLISKLQKLAITVSILQKVTSVHSQSLPSFIYHTATTAPDINTSNSLDEIFMSELSWIHAILVICFLIILGQSIVIYFLHKSKPSKNTKVQLELTSGGECVIIPLATLPLCPSYYQIQHPIIRKITASNFTSRQIIADWSPFDIVDKLSTKSISVPSRININYFQYRKLVKILKQPFCAYIMITHQGFSTVLQNEIDLSDTLDLSSI